MSERGAGNEASIAAALGAMTYDGVTRTEPVEVPQLDTDLAVPGGIGRTRVGSAWNVVGGSRW
jgi:hypothetical protein